MAMSISVQKSAKRTNIEHNNRKMKEKEKLKNNHIDYTKSDTNKYLVQRDIKELYQTEFGGALENYNAKQKRNDRKIKNYYKHIEASKKTDVQQEMIIQIGDKDDFLNDEKREEAMAILEKWYEGFEERNPNLKVYNAVIHNDEASPHMHLNFVPVASGYKRGLEKQVAFDRALIQQDDSLDKDRPFTQWRENEVAVLEGLLNERGIERKLVGKNEYKDVREYKTEMDKKLEHAKAVKLEFEEIYAEAKYYENPLAVLQQVDASKKVRVGRFFNKGKNEVILLEEGYESVLDIAVTNVRAQKDLEKMEESLAKAKEIEAQSRLMEKERARMERERERHALEMSAMQSRLREEEEEKEKMAKEYEARIERERNEKNRVMQENEGLKNENNGLKNENKTLRDHISQLEVNVRLSVVKAKERANKAITAVVKVSRDMSSAIGHIVNREKSNLSTYERDVLNSTRMRSLEVSKHIPEDFGVNSLDVPTKPNVELKRTKVNESIQAYMDIENVKSYKREKRAEKIAKEQGGPSL